MHGFTATVKRLSLCAVVALALFPDDALAQGPLTNGQIHTGAISAAAEIDTWTFTASQNDSIALSIGEVGSDPGFNPWIRLRNPNGVEIGSNSGALVAQITVTAPLSGTYTVLVASGDIGNDGVGSYRLTLAQAPGAFVVAGGDEGGAMTNGADHHGSLYVGDLDQWSFQANQHDFIALSIGEILPVGPDPSFFPWIRLVSPTGVVLDSAYGSLVAQISLNAPLTGTYTVIVGTADTFRQATGTYRLMLAKAPGAISVPTGDQGGAMTNGVNHAGSLYVGDLDTWTFQASQNDYIALSIGEPPFGEIDPGFFPWIRLVGPTGAVLDSSYGARVGQISLNAPLTGTYTVIVGTADTFRQAAGNYLLTLAKIPDAVIVPTGDQGGALLTGPIHPGQILVGDLDQWTFQANKDDYIALSIGEPAFGEVDPGFFPWIRLVGPTGALLDYAYGARVAQISLNAPLTGTYTVIVSTADTFRQAEGSYQLTLAKAPGAYTLTTGDQGGTMANLVPYSGSIYVGDLDQWTFHATKGAAVSITITEPPFGEVDPGFFPWIRIVGPTGVWLFSEYGTNSAAVTFTPPLSGDYTVIVGTADTNRFGTGSYVLSGTGITVPGFTVTPSAGANGTINPNVAQEVPAGGTISFTLTPSAGYMIAGVGGTCGGTLVGQVFTTAPVNAACTVIASFTPIVTFTITPSVASAGGTITPSTPQSVTAGATRNFTLTPSAGFTIASVGGTCGGTLAGAVFTTAPVNANCTVIVTFSSMTLALTKTSLRFGAVTAGGTFQYQTAAQDVALTQSGPGTVTWTATPSQPWLRVSPASGIGSALLSVSVAPAAGLPASGTLNGAVTFTFTGAANNPGPIAVTLTLKTASDSPFGFIDTPKDNQTGVTGAIPFTGWLLDDIDMVRVMICRAAFGGEVAPIDPNCGGAAQIFVGFGVFIEGARPDVAAAFPTYPANTKAGWGFMVLTNMLPNQGNGTYAFQFYGQDREGHTLSLGTRTISCSNATATKPFGAIDTPLQGGTASGSSFVNFGWALTQNPKVIPIDGSTITVVVDGVSVGTADYNHFRPDVATAFPGLANSDGAVGFKILDTTTLANGMHTLSWVVQDNAGAIEGIGSRYFTVANGVGSATAPSVSERAVSHVSDARARVDAITSAPLDQSPVIGRRGWDLEGPWSQYGIGQAGRAVIRGEELDRFELELGEHAGERYTGYLRVGDELSTLPVGSTLRDTGSFTWAPGVGFVGTYDLVFVRWADGQPVARRDVRIILAAKGSGQVGTQVTIDTPRAQQDVEQPFLAAGWAIDLDASVGTGIDTLHVWAFPATGGAPIFLGTATYGGIRPDVAAVHGDRFRASGFGVSVQGLAAGTYDLQIFPWSNVAGGFAAPGVVRVHVR